LKFFGDFLTKTELKLVVFGWFLSTLISRLKKGSKSQAEKSEDFQKIFGGAWARDGWLATCHRDFEK